MINNVIYIFKKEDILYAVAKYDEGLTFGQGFKLVPDPKSKLNTPDAILRRARKSIIASVSNSLNAVSLWGKSVLDSNGNVDWNKFKDMERRITDAGLYKYKVIKNYQTKDIDLKTAEENKLI